MHQNGYFGTKDCQKQNAIFASEITIKSGKCVAFPGFDALMYTCKPGPCPATTSIITDNDEVEMNLERMAQIMLDAHRHHHAPTSAMMMKQKTEDAVTT